MSNKEIHTCEGVIGLNNSNEIIRKMIGGLDDTLCGKKASLFEDGQWYCKTHAPSQIDKRNNARFLAWAEKRNLR